MVLSLTTTSQVAFTGSTSHREGNLAAGYDSLTNPALPILPTAGVAVVSGSKLNGVKAELRTAIRRFVEACFSARRISASWSLRCLKALQPVQVAAVAALIVQLVFLVWQDGQRLKGQERVDQRWQQTKQYWKLADRIDAYEEVARERERLQDLRIEALEERMELLELRGLDNYRASSPQQSSSTTPLF